VITRPCTPLQRSGPTGQIHCHNLTARKVSLSFATCSKPDLRHRSSLIEMQQPCTSKHTTPVRRKVPPLLAFFGTSAPANGVIGPMIVADYAAWDRDT
jgi:hypothetical protein